MNKNLRYLYLSLIIVLIISVSLIPFLFKLPYNFRLIIFSTEFFLLGTFLSLTIFLLFIPFSTITHTSNLSASHLEELTSSLAKNQKELVKLNQKLEKKLLSKDEKLRETQKEMLSLEVQVIEQEKLASLAKMASGVVHEIKTPLSVMKTSTYLLRNFTDKEKIKGQIDIIEKEIVRINEIATSLMEYARSTKEVPLGWIDISALLKDIIEELEFTGKLENIEVKNSILSSFPPVFAHKDRLKEVLLNLINNAIESMEEGGILYLEGQIENEKAHIFIKDTGKGIPEEDIKNIFDPFFTTKGGGTGLGLAISYAFIKRFGGDIQVQSKVGEGTTFDIILKTKV